MIQPFKLPIEYLKKKEKVNENIITDLELLKTNSFIPFKKEETFKKEENKTENEIPLLNSIFKPKTKIANIILKKQSEFYTYDKVYLKETQKLIKNFKNENSETQEIEKTKCYDDFYDLWNQLTNDEGFIDKYYYVDIDYFKFLNNSAPFLKILSIYNLLSPILSLALPIFLLLVPFFMLKFSGLKITISSYIEQLKIIFAKHAIGNIFNIFKNISWEKRVYGIISILFYLFSIYQNTIVCYRFYHNFYQIHKDIESLKKYLHFTFINITNLEKQICKLSVYDSFLNDIQMNKIHLENIYQRCNKISEFKISNFARKINEIGDIMNLYYELHDNANIKKVIQYSFQLNGYIENINCLNDLHRTNQINSFKFGKKINFNNIYLPNTKSKKDICKNDISLNKNIIITGPNASGKTTILKSVLFNILFSQMFGMGFYEKATLNLYNKIHCYLNIPDTSGRDSLFQAEARRCKEIIDSIKNNKKHFCIFDELFSGTNPIEANASSIGFIKYLQTFPNTNFILTTHLHSICNTLENQIKNCSMETNNKDDLSLEFTYKIKNGISNTLGGLKVLYELNFPKYVIEHAEREM